MRLANQQRFRSGSHSAASLPLFSCRLTCGAASVRLRRSEAKRTRVARSLAHKPESCDSLIAMMCSMSVSPVDSKQLPVYGLYIAPKCYTISRSIDCGYG